MVQIKPFDVLFFTFPDTQLSRNMSPKIAKSIHTRI